MEVVFYEDPACSWCWAFQPVDTTFLFEFGGRIKHRRVMGGLRDFPIADINFLIGQWNLAAKVSGMPFDAAAVKKRVFRTTFHACRIVKAAQISEPAVAEKLLRRIREAFYVERRHIDQPDELLEFAMEVGLNMDRLRDHISSQRAEVFFQQDRIEASRQGFGFPTVVVHSDATEHRPPIMLQGLEPYSELCHAISVAGLPLRSRRRFQDTPEDWKRLFQIRSRLTEPELRLVTSLEPAALARRLASIGAERDGPFISAPVSENARLVGSTSD